MNLTLREVISQVKTPNKAVNSDSRMTNKYIHSLLKKHRDNLIKQLDRKFQLMKLRYLFQTLDCVDLIPAPTISECCGVRSQYTIYRTREKLPETINSLIGPVFGRVTNIDNSEELFEINPTEWNRKIQDTNFKYNHTKYFYYSNGYLYFPNLEWKKIAIEGFFDEEVHSHNCLCGEKKNHCISKLDEQFRVPRHMLAYIIDSVNKEIANLYDKLPNDNEENKNDSKKD